MKKKYSSLSGNARIVGVRGSYGRREFIDFYIEHPKGKEYAFTRRYTHKVYELTKGGISIKSLLCMRSSDVMTMALVKHLSYAMTDFMSEFEWLAA